MNDNSEGAMAAQPDLDVPETVTMSGQDALVLAGCAMVLQRWWATFAVPDAHLGPAGIAGLMIENGFLDVEPSVEGARMTATLSESFLGALVRVGEALHVGASDAPGGRLDAGESPGAMPS